MSDIRSFVKQRLNEEADKKYRKKISALIPNIFKKIYKKITIIFYAGVQAC